MKIAPEGTALESILIEVAPKTRARVRMSDSNVVEPDCGHRAMKAPGRWYCLTCGVKFEINDVATAETHAAAHAEHAFSWQCAYCGKLVALRSQ